MSSVDVRPKNDENDIVPCTCFHSTCVVRVSNLCPQATPTYSYSDLKKETNVLSRLGRAKREKIIAVEQKGGKTLHPRNAQ